MKKSYEIAKQMTDVKNGTSNETGFIGDVYIDGKLNGYPVEDYMKKGHTHLCSDITDLEERLSSLEVNTEHTHTCADITDLEEKLEGKADSDHTHTCSDITDLQTQLDTKADSEHTHTCADITDLQGKLDGKANNNHTHTSFNTLNVGTLSTNTINGNNSNSLTRIKSSRNSNATARLELAVDTTGGRIGDIIVSQYNAYFKNLTRSATLLDASGNTSFPGTVTSTNLKADNDTRLAAVEAEVDTKADLEHTHTCADITDLQETLEGKADSEHTHTVFDNDVTFNGKINGLSIRNTNVGPCENTIPCVRSDGCMEVGKYIDFHDTNSTADYDVRLTATKGNLTANSNLLINDLSLNSSYPTITFGAGAQKNDYARIRFSGGNNAGNLELATADDANEPIYVRQYSGTFTTARRTATLLDGSGNTSFPGVVSTPQVNTNTILFGSSLGLSDYGRILFRGSKENSYMEIATSDDANEPIYVRQYKYASSNNWASVGHQITLMDANGNQVFNTITATNVKADNETRLAAVEAEVDTKADIEHTHTCAEITDLQTQLDTKADKDHTHTSFDNDISLPNKELTNELTPHILNVTQLPHAGFDYTYELTNDDTCINITISPSYFETYAGKPITLTVGPDPETPYAIILKTEKYDPSSIKNNVMFHSSIPSYYSMPTKVINNSYSFSVDLKDATKEQESIMMCYSTITSTNFLQLNLAIIILDLGLARNIDMVVNDTVPTTRFLVDWLYPVGSIYMSMNSTNPRFIFGGTWEQIQDRFLLCSAGESKQEGGSELIQTNNLPQHYHTINLNTDIDGTHKHGILSKYDDFNYNMGADFKSKTLASDHMSIPSDTGAFGDDLVVGRSKRTTYTEEDGVHSHHISGTTGYGNGKSQAYWQPYMTCYCWYRTA